MIKFKLAGIGLLASALLVGCGDDAPTPEKEVVTNEVKPEAEKPSEPVKEETPQAPQIEAGLVFGSLDTSKLKKTADSMYLDEEREVLYLMAGEEVFQVEVNFDPSLGLNKELDKQFLTDHAADYMAEDATLTQTLSDKEFVYSSASLGKKYTVLFSGEEAVTRVIISQNFD